MKPIENQRNCRCRKFEINAKKCLKHFFWQRVWKINASSLSTYGVWHVVHFSSHHRTKWWCKSRISKMKIKVTYISNLLFEKRQIDYLFNYSKANCSKYVLSIFLYWCLIFWHNWTLEQKMLKKFSPTSLGILSGLPNLWTQRYFLPLVVELFSKILFNKINSANRTPNFTLTSYQKIHFFSSFHGEKTFIK